MTSTSHANAIIPSLRQLLQALLFSGLLSIAFLDSRYFFLTWFAFVPLLFSIENAGLAKTYLLGLVAGFACYLTAMYWIVDFITISKGYSLSKSLLIASGYWLYCAHLIALLLMLFRWLKRQTRLHEFLLFPLILATFTSSFPMLFSMRLGESQVNFHSALQAIEFTGVHGLDVVIALFNIVIFRFISQWLSGNSVVSVQTLKPWLAAAFLILIWFTYGLIQYPLWERKIETWNTLKIGIVQPNEVPKLGETNIYPGYSYAYPPEMEMTERLNSLGAQIIIWPESQPKNYLNNAKVRNAFQQNIRSLGSALLFQDMRHNKSRISGKLIDQTNTAIMIDGAGQEHEPYIKMKRIPFGEYVPFSNDGSAAKHVVKKLFGDFLVETTKGEEHKVFTHGEVNIIPLICYETTSPSFVGNAVDATSARIDRTKGSLIVALSNDGWFGSTHQPFQHIMPSALRAIENRLPVVHVTNNGPSIVVTPSGKITFESEFQSAGGYITNVPHSSTAQGSFYSKHPDLFERILRLVTLFILLLSLWNTVKRHISKQ